MKKKIWRRHFIDKYGHTIVIDSLEKINLDKLKKEWKIKEIFTIPKEK